MKKYLFSTLACLMLLSVCARPLPACAQSGTSTCQVTATAVKTQTPSEPGDGGSGEPDRPNPGDGPGEPSPGEPGTSEPGDGAEQPGLGNGQPEEPDPGKGPSTAPDDTGVGDGTPPGEDGAPEAVQEPGDAEPGQDKPQPVPGQGEEHEPADGQDGGTPEAEPSQTRESGQAGSSGEPEENGRWFWWLLAVLAALCILAALAAAGAFRHIWTWMLFVLFKGSRRRFHSILTKEKNFFIHVRDARDDSRLAQEIIDSAGSLGVYEAEIRKEAAVTEIPCQCRMRFSYTDRSGRRRCRETGAEEEKTFRILEELDGAGDVEVRITCRGTGINIPLYFCL